MDWSLGVLLSIVPFKVRYNIAYTLKETIIKCINVYYTFLNE